MSTAVNNRYASSQRVFDGEVMEFARMAVSCPKTEGIMELMEVTGFGVGMMLAYTSKVNHALLMLH